MGDKRTFRLVVDLDVDPEQWAISTGAPAQDEDFLEEAVVQYTMTALQNAEHIRGSGAVVELVAYGEMEEPPSTSDAPANALIHALSTGQISPTVWSCSLLLPSVVNTEIAWETTDIREFLTRALEEADRRLAVTENPAPDERLVLLIDQVRITPDVQDLYERVLEHPVTTQIIGTIEDDDPPSENTGQDEHTDPGHQDDDNSCVHCEALETISRTIDCLRAPATPHTARDLVITHMSRHGLHGVSWMWLKCAQTAADRYRESGVTITAPHDEDDRLNLYSLRLIDICQRDAAAERLALTPSIVQREGGDGMVVSLTLHLAFIAAALQPAVTGT